MKEKQSGSYTSMHICHTTTDIWTGSKCIKYSSPVWGTTFKSVYVCHWLHVNAPGVTWDINFLLPFPPLKAFHSHSPLFLLFWRGDKAPWQITDVGTVPANKIRDSLVLSNRKDRQRKRENAHTSSLSLLSRSALSISFTVSLVLPKH